MKSSVKQLGEQKFFTETSVPEGLAMTGCVLSHVDMQS